MKKKFYIGMALLTGAAVLSAFIANKKAQAYDLVRANIEALAADEGGGEGGESYRPCVIDPGSVCISKVRDSFGKVHIIVLWDFRQD